MRLLIQEMLQIGIIRHSTNTFSSHFVSLKKKKRWTWHFCVNYRALNNLTVKDQFPIPTVNELLDELHGSMIFTEVDLRSGYHQIHRCIHLISIRRHFEPMKGIMSSW